MVACRGRKLAVLLAVLVLCLLMVAVWAPTALATLGDTGTTGDGFEWEEIAGGQMMITGYSGGGGALTLPATINALPVVAIDDDAFLGTPTITSVDIPSSVTSIGSGAFSTCSSLSSVTLHGGLQTIGAGAFYHAPIASIDIPGSVTSIGVNAFSGCSSLGTITLHSGLQSIGEGAFYQTPVATIDIPGSVTSIGVNAFSACSSLSSVTLHSGLQTIGAGAFYNNTALTSIDIPASVTSIGEEAFNSCSSLGSITLHEGLQTIGNYAFEATAITSIDIPASVDSVSYAAFAQCLSLSDVTLHNGLQTIGQWAFFMTPITSVDIPASVTSIDSWSFNSCSHLTRAVIRNPTVTIGLNVFSTTDLDTDGIYGFAGSTAQTYATNNSHPFHFIYTVALEDTTLPDEYVLEGEDLDTPPTPSKAGYLFGGWFTDASLTTDAVFPMSVVGDMAVYAKWTEFKLTLSPADGHIYTGGRITITPSIEGGTWDFDSTLLSRDGYAFTGLKPGTAHVTYTVRQQAVSADVVITASTLPDTGQDFTTAWVLLGAGLLVALAGMMFVAVERSRRRES